MGVLKRGGELLVVAGVVVAASGGTARGFCYMYGIYPPSSSPLRDGFVGQHYQQPICVQSYNTGGLIWMHSSPPPGLTTYEDPSYFGECFSNNPPSLIVDGFPTTPGLHDFSATAQGFFCGGTITGDYTIKVYGSCLSVTGTPPPGVVGQPYAAQFAASGGQPGYRFFVADGTVPPGLSLDAAGRLAGIPTATGSYALRVRATDAAFCYGDVDVTVDVSCAVMDLEPDALPPGVVDVAFAQRIDVTGGLAPYDVRVSSGSLPAGLVLSSWHVIQGVPKSFGTSTFTVTATDDAGCAESRTYSLQILARPDVVAGLGASSVNENLVAVIRPDGAALVALTAYGAGSWGALALGLDIDGLGVDRLVTGPGPGPVLGPHVRAFDRTGLPIGRVSFFAYGTLRYGVHPGGIDVDRDGSAEILTGAGAGEAFGPHVRGFDVDGGPPRPIAGINFFAYGTLRHGVHVAGAWLDGDDSGDILTAPGPGPAFAPTVRGWRHAGQPVRPIPGLAFDAFAGARHGARVASGDVDGDPLGDILVGRGAGPVESADVRGFEHDGSGPSLLPGFDVRVFNTHFGAIPAATDMGSDPPDELLAAGGPDPAASTVVRTYEYDGATLTLVTGIGEAFPGSSHGANVSSGHLDY